jgi:hypothetical protein
MSQDDHSVYNRCDHVKTAFAEILETNRNHRGLTPRSRQIARQCPGLSIITICIALLCALPLNAQQSTGAINGTVRDVSGAVVPGAAVTLTNVNTSVSRAESTNGAGVYVINNILPGSYTLKADHPGFAGATRTGITIQVNQTATFDFTLQVGSQTQTVNVATSTVQLESSTAELGTVITTTTVTDLPLNGRNFTALLPLTPGASPANTSQTSFGGQANPVGAFSFPSMNGQPNRSNYFMLDGISDNEWEFSTFAFAPIVDDIQEFKIQSHNDQAAYGDVIGGIVNVVTKTGTNQFHGTLWEFLRNDAFDADNPLTFSKTPLHQDQYGLNLGGPAIVPHLYNGKSKTFFFGSYEAYRQNTAATAYVVTPTAAERTGDFSQLTTQLYNPFTTRPDPANPGNYTRDPFPGNIIPTSMLNPGMVTYANLLWPLPNTSSPAGNLLDRTPGIWHQNEWNARIDETLNNSNSMWFRYSSMNQPSTSSAGFPGYIGYLDIDAQNYGFNYLHIFNPTTTLDAQFGRNFIFFDYLSHFTEGTNQSIVSQVGFSPTWACGYAALGYSQDCLVPEVGSTGYITGGAGAVSNNPLTDDFQWNADLSKVLGHHLIQTGFIFQRTSEVGHSLQSQAFSTPSQTSNPEIPGTGDGMASALLGVLDSSFREANVVPVNGLRSIAGYVQDQWKATPTLTFNVGLRYGVTLWPTLGSNVRGTNAVGTMDYDNGTYILQRPVGSCATVGAAPCIPGGFASVPYLVISPNNHLLNNSYDNWQPRLGFAYQATHSDVIRGAVGLFFDQWAGVEQTILNMNGTWPSIGNTTLQNQNPLNSVATVDALNPQGTTTFLPPANPYQQAGYYRAPTAKDPMSLQFNLGVQHLLNSKTSFELNYVGSTTERLLVGGNYNVALTPGPGNPVDRQPYPYLTASNYDRAVGRANFNALEAKLSRSLSNGLSGIVSYTYSRTMNIGCDGILGIEGCSVQDPYHLSGDYSAAGIDLPQNLAISALYQLPIGRGRYVNIDNRLLDGFVGGWQVNGIFTHTSGLAYNLNVASDIANTGNVGGDRLDKIGNPVLSNPNRNEWFNTAAFVAPAPYTFGSEGRNDLRQDPYSDLDASVFKAFPIKEQMRFEFRIEAFNSLNHITYGAPGTTIDTPTFGVVGSTRSTERQVQLALKFYF